MQSLDLMSRFSELKDPRIERTNKSSVSPHLAAVMKNKKIDITTINLPITKNLIIEGADGLLVLLNKNVFMIDLINHLNLPVILVKLVHDWEQSIIPF